MPKIKIKLQLPEIKSNNQKSNIIPTLNKNIEDILSEIIKKQNENIKLYNEEEIKETLDKADMIIVECHTTKIYNVNKNKHFTRLMYEYQGLKLKYESYQINKKVALVDKKYLEIKKQQNNIKEENNNLVYNILGFIASFSIVSAAVSAIDKMNSLTNIMIFMAFTAFILLTTLIGLNNFYRKSEKMNKLQDNYILWKMMIFVIIILVGYKGIEYLKDNSEYILECIGKGIGQTITVEKETIENTY